MVFTTNHKETLSLPSPQVSGILVSTHLSILSLPTHASVLSNPNSAPHCFTKVALGEVTTDLHVAKAKGNLSVLILISQHSQLLLPS